MMRVHAEAVFTNLGWFLFIIRKENMAVPYTFRNDPLVENNKLSKTCKLAQVKKPEPTLPYFLGSLPKVFPSSYMPAASAGGCFWRLVEEHTFGQC